MPLPRRGTCAGRLRAVGHQLSNVTDAGPPWDSEHFVFHYFHGNGQAVTLRQVGHLEKIVDAYMKIVDQRLKGQIADVARGNIGRSFTYPFEDVYDMEFVVFSVGNTTIGGTFSGSCKQVHGALEIVGRFEFYQKDWFADPFDLGKEFPGAIPYNIFDKWAGSLRGSVLKDRTKSRYREK